LPGGARESLVESAFSQQLPWMVGAAISIAQLMMTLANAH